ncbi:MAG: hypothetical protein M3450_02430 [Actinomycetota bacterium]|nr:hypothetical protein [Actinomycetota bacterium]
MTDTADLLDERVQSLAGRVVVAVRYFQLISEVDDCSWERDQGLHVIDFGIDILTDASAHRLTWARSPTTYSITLQDGSMVEEISAGRFHRVEERPPWSLVKGEPVTRARVHSIHEERADRPFPVAISLVFGNSRTILSAAANFMDAGTPLFLGGDEIAVVWETTVVPTLFPEIAADILATPWRQGVIDPSDSAGHRRSRSGRHAARPMHNGTSWLLSEPATASRITLLIRNARD